MMLKTLRRSSLSFLKAEQTEWLQLLLISEFIISESNESMLPERTDKIRQNLGKIFQDQPAKAAFSVQE